MPPQPGAPAASVTSVHHRDSLTACLGECVASLGTRLLYRVVASLGTPSVVRSAALWGGGGSRKCVIRAWCSVLSRQRSHWSVRGSTGDVSVVLALRSRRRC